MKKSIILPSGAFKFDTETQETALIESQREAISRIYRIEEDCIVSIRFKNYSKDIEAEAGDLVITFYDDDYPNKAVVIKNKDWVENLDTYNKIMQERKEKWAKDNSAKSEDTERISI